MEPSQPGDQPTRSTGGAHPANPGFLCSGELSGRRGSDAGGSGGGGFRPGPKEPKRRLGTQSGQRAKGGAPGGRGRAAEHRPGGRGGGRVFPGAFPTRPSDSLGVGELPGPALDERRRRRPGKSGRWAAGSHFPPNPVGRACGSLRCSLGDRSASRDCLLGSGVSGSLHAGSRAEDSRPSSASPGLALSLPRVTFQNSPGHWLPSADCSFLWRCATPEAQPPNS